MSSLYNYSFWDEFLAAHQLCGFHTPCCDYAFSVSTLLLWPVTTQHTKKHSHVATTWVNQAALKSILAAKDLKVVPKPKYFLGIKWWNFFSCPSFATTQRFTLITANPLTAAHAGILYVEGALLSLVFQLKGNIGSRVEMIVNIWKAILWGTGRKCFFPVKLRYYSIIDVNIM